MVLSSLMALTRDGSVTQIVNVRKVMTTAAWLHSPQICPPGVAQCLEEMSFLRAPNREGRGEGQARTEKCEAKSQDCHHSQEEFISKSTLVLYTRWRLKRNILNSWPTRKKTIVECEHRRERT